MINVARLLDAFLSLVAIDSPSGEEEAISAHLEARLRALGLTAERDAMNNVIARLDGEGEPVLLMAHMDTVMPGRGIKPVIRDGTVYSDGTTILAADDKSGIAVILEVLHVITENQLAHPSIEVAITVSEETGLVGAKNLDTSRLKARRGISFDVGGPVGIIVTSAPWHNHIDVSVHGKAAHSGAQPEQGISAIVVASDAIMHMPLGRIDDETTANIGIVHGGVARNIIPEHVHLTGEARSRNLEKLEQQTQRMVTAFEEAAARYGAAIDVHVERAYNGYVLSAEDTMVKCLMAACRSVGVEPVLAGVGGGSDVNVLNQKGFEVVNLGTGMANAHTSEEYVKIADMVTSAQIALACVQSLVG